MDQTPLLPQPRDITDFEECINHTDAKIAENPASSQAAAWARRLVEIGENPAQSFQDLAHRPFEAYMRQARLLRTDGRPTEEAIAAARKLPNIAASAHKKDDYIHRQFEGNRQAALTLHEVDPKAASVAFRTAERFTRNDWQLNAAQDVRKSCPGLAVALLAQDSSAKKYIPSFSR